MKSREGTGPTLEVRNLWKVFGAKPDAAIAMSRQGSSRSEVLAATGCTIGVRDVGFAVAKGETFVVMGLSGSGKSHTRAVPVTVGRTDLGRGALRR